MPLVNQEAERIFKGMKSKNSHRFKDLYGKRDKEVMYATANKLAQKKQTKQKTWKSGMGFKEEVVSETCETRYCRLCRKKETRKQCSYGGALWDRYAVKDATKEEQKDAAEESGITSEGGEGMSEANKSGDNSLRDWFSKSKSSDGKPGWVQLGGKYAGKPCARQPGQTTKPKCGSSKMKRNLNKDEEEAAFRRKNAKDPNPNRKGKAINVKTEETQSVDEGKKDACYHKVKSRYSVWPSAYASGALVKCRKKGAKNWGNSTKKEEFEGGLTFGEFQEKAMKCWKGYEKKGTKKMFGKTYNNCVKKESVNVSEADMTGAPSIKNAKPAKSTPVKNYPGLGYAPTIAGLKKASKGGEVKKEEVTNEGAAWTKKEGQNKSGGLNEKGRKSYERENPGSDLKAPSKKVGNKRRASFCARMKGMRKRQKPSNNTGDDRLSKSLRAWNC